VKLDPTVQVAAISVFATTITTIGLIVVAIINNRKERTKSASNGVEAGLDERAVLGRIFILMSENEELETRNKQLEDELVLVKAENRLLKEKPVSEGGTT